MRQDRQLQVLDRLLAVVTRGEAESACRESRVQVERYTSPTQYEAERKVLFRKLPIIVGRETDLPEPGTFFTHDATGVPILVTRAPGGRVHAMLNACRHRGARLVGEDQRGPTTAFTCRYHGWTYDLRGCLGHVPLPRCFPTLRRDESGLVELPCDVRHGFVWVLPTPGGSLPLVSWLGDFDDDLASFGLGSHDVFRRRETTHAANWKLVLGTLLEAYSVKTLHPQTLARTHREDIVSDTSGPHARAAFARRNLPEIANHGRAQWDLRKYATVSYFLFPNTVLIFHADAISQISVYPESLETVTFVHTLLVPAGPRDDARRAHDERTWDLVDEVFRHEALEMAESVQSVLHADALWAFRLGTLEHLVRFLHDAIDRALAQAST